MKWILKVDLIFEIFCAMGFETLFCGVAERGGAGGSASIGKDYFWTSCNHFCGNIAYIREIGATKTSFGVCPHSIIEIFDCEYFILQEML